MAGLTKVGVLRPPVRRGEEAAGREGAAGGAEAWASREPELARAADLARSAARPNGVAALLSPGLRGAGGALRTGDNICPHAPRLRGRQPIRREQGERQAVPEGDNTIRRGEGAAPGDRRATAHPAGCGERGCRRGGGDRVIGVIGAIGSDAARGEENGAAERAGRR